jgi:predicted nucleotidyltransferase
MSMPDAQPPRPMSAMILRVAVRLAVLLGVLAAVLFGSAGRLDWAAAW